MDLNLKQTEVGEASGVGQANISNFERGEKSVGLGSFLKLMKYCHQQGIDTNFVVLGHVRQAPAETIKDRATQRTATSQKRRAALGDEQPDKSTGGVSKGKRTRAG